MLIIPLTADACVNASAHWSDEFDVLMGRLLWQVHTPYAHALLAVHDMDPDEVLGIACATIHGTSARITLMRTHDSAEGHSVHAALAEALLAQLDAEGCTSCSLVSAPTAEPRWAALGFTAAGSVLRYTGGRSIQATCDEVIHLEPHHRLGVLHLDRQACGEDRSTLLMEHGYLGLVYLDGTRIRGFSLLLLGEGLIIADAPNVGLELQRWLFPVQEHMLLPMGNAAHEHLTKQDYVATTIGVRLVRGAALDARPAMVFADAWGRA